MTALDDAKGINGPEEEDEMDTTNDALEIAEQTVRCDVAALVATAGSDGR